MKCGLEQAHTGTHPSNPSRMYAYAAQLLSRAAGHGRCRLQHEYVLMRAFYQFNRPCPLLKPTTPLNRTDWVETHQTNVPINGVLTDARLKFGIFDMSARVMQAGQVVWSQYSYSWYAFLCAEVMHARQTPR